MSLLRTPAVYYSNLKALLLCKEHASFVVRESHDTAAVAEGEHVRCAEVFGQSCLEDTTTWLEDFEAGLCADQRDGRRSKITQPNLKYETERGCCQVGMVYCRDGTYLCAFTAALEANAVKAVNGVIFADFHVDGPVLPAH